MATRKRNKSLQSKASRAETAGKVATDLIVAVGASGANSGPVERFLSDLDLGDDAAIVLVFQHREALDEEGFRQALAAHERELTMAADGTSVEAGRIYWAAPNTILTMEDGRFRSRPAQQAPGERGTIDSFLVSAAQDQEWNVIGIVFSGTGGDGVLGFAALKEAGGLTLAEDNAEVARDGLAGSSSPLALADFVLPSEDLPQRVHLHVRHLTRYKQAADVDADAADVSEALTRVAAILRSKTGHDFHGYKTNTFLRRIQRRMQVVQAQTIDAYVDVLQAQADEPQNLFNDLLIGVTQFFRDRREFDLLETQVIPRLFDGKTRNDQLRIWVLGCSTGEEAYSIGILLREHMAKLDEVPQFQIFLSVTTYAGACRSAMYSAFLARPLSNGRGRGGDVYAAGLLSDVVKGKSGRTLVGVSSRWKMRKPRSTGAKSRV